MPLIRTGRGKVLFLLLHRLGDRSSSQRSSRRNFRWNSGTTTGPYGSSKRRITAVIIEESHLTTTTTTTLLCPCCTRTNRQ
jgi:hypothetical protein